MSQENVEIVRAAFAAWNAHRYQAVFALFHPELVYHPRADEPDPSPHVGRDAYERLIYGFVDSFSEATTEVLELIDAGDHVIASTLLHVVLHEQGSASGAGVSDTYVFVYKLRDGLVVEGWEYRTKQEALEAVGLSEQAMSQENVEVVEAFYAAFTHGDEASMLEILNADVERDTTARIDGRLTHGFEATRASVEEGFSSFEDVRIEPQEMRDSGDQVAVRVRGWFRGASSGVETEVSWAAVFTIRDGKIGSYKDCGTWPQALEAAGMSE